MTTTETTREETPVQWDASRRSSKRKSSSEPWPRQRRGPPPPVRRRRALRALLARNPCPLGSSSLTFTKRRAGRASELASLSQRSFRRSLPSSFFFLESGVKQKLISLSAPSAFSIQIRKKNVTDTLPPDSSSYASRLATEPREEKARRSRT
jgi:hypothetical protein